MVLKNKLIFGRGINNHHNTTVKIPHKIKHETESNSMPFGANKNSIGIGTQQLYAPQVRPTNMSGSSGSVSGGSYNNLSQITSSLSKINFNHKKNKNVKLHL